MPSLLRNKAYSDDVALVAATGGTASASLSLSALVIGNRRIELIKTPDIEFNPETPVMVVGIRNGYVTEDGTGVQYFPNLVEAKSCFPDLELNEPTERFTRAAMHDDHFRFETKQASESLSR